MANNEYQFINNKIPKEIKKINKLLKKEHFEPLVIGIEALVKCHLPSSDALLLANWQECAGLSFILNANQLPTKWGSLESTPFILAIAKFNNIPDFALQNVNDTSKNAVKAKFDLITNTRRWFEYNKETAQKVPQKYRGIIDNVLLNINFEDLFYEFGNLKELTVNPYQLYHISLANYWSKINHHANNPLLAGFHYAHDVKVPFKPWLIIDRTKKDGYQFIHGRNQQQLIKFLLHSDYMKNNDLRFHFNLDLSLGWNKVLEKQLELGQTLSDGMLFALNQYQEKSKSQQKEKKTLHSFIIMKQHHNNEQQQLEQGRG